MYLDPLIYITSSLIWWGVAQKGCEGGGEGVDSFRPFPFSPLPLPSFPLFLAFQCFSILCRCFFPSLFLLCSIIGTISEKCPGQRDHPAPGFPTSSLFLPLHPLPLPPPSSFIFRPFSNKIIPPPRHPSIWPSLGLWPPSIPLGSFSRICPPLPPPTSITTNGGEAEIFHVLWRWLLVHGNTWANTNYFHYLFKKERKGDGSVDWSMGWDAPIFQSVFNSPPLVPCH